MAQRKLQADIDRVLKLVQQGVTLFEETFDKMTHATNQTSKDKAEADLKTSIKKLQRQRDQIKTWLQSNDIKDKSSLMEHRKLIETQMERFKACEKEMKTKAFSKEGLSAQQKLDPKEVAKMEMSHWVSTMVDELGQQIERTEAEVELLRSQTKKKKPTSGSDGRTSELEALNDRRRWHIGKLELIMRLLENGQISPERVGEVKDDIQYYVESNVEEDFTEDDDLYESLNLQEEEEHYGLHDDLLSSHDTSSIIEDSNLSGEKSPIKEKMTISGAQILRGPSVRKPTMESGTVRPAIVSGRTGVVTGMVLPTGTAPRTAPAPLPSLRYASAAAAAASSTTATTPSNPTSAKSPGQIPAVPQRSNSLSFSGTTSGSISAQPSAESPKKQSQQAPHRPFAAVASPDTKLDALPGSGGPRTNLSGSDPSTSQEQSANGGSSSSLVHNPSGQSNQSGNSSQSAAEPSSHLNTDRSPSPSISQKSGQSPPQGVDVDGIPNSGEQKLTAPTSQSNDRQSMGGEEKQQQEEEKQAGLQVNNNGRGEGESLNGGMLNHNSNQENNNKSVSSLADLVETYDQLKSHTPSMNEMTKIIETGISGLPQIQDAEKPYYYAPRNPYPTSSHYPQHPMAFEKRPLVWNDIEVEVLFYLFYYHQGGYLQYLAAKELKKRAWRFHKYYLTWFQRAKNPEEMADDYEKGSYTYFDWEADWLLRTKTPFQFDYKHLEDSFSLFLCLFDCLCVLVSIAMDYKKKPKPARLVVPLSISICTRRNSRSQDPDACKTHSTHFDRPGDRPTETDRPGFSSLSPSRLLPLGTPSELIYRIIDPAITYQIKEIQRKKKNTFGISISSPRLSDHLLRIISVEAPIVFFGNNIRRLLQDKTSLLLLADLWRTKSSTK
ncbi:hypothetical protein Pst134EA_026747 [Puccinia striiformis f. sp. tritici]|uniref:hypothetical protein n=1 Tax=Puccinia striiformis f. sp. tritici TaxID=168172 RepID=UPI0020080A84|nr:hypothetical protein Pst134EA_026747 [Puccinia striiformis f. sp. tritici]KAH9450034.1 hypothetical protein Pst134EA_026747 [Puccinia striiformis f. sp. tritici]